MQNSNFSFYLPPLSLELREGGDIDLQFENYNGSALNESFEEECLRSYQNFSYYNVSCDTPTAFSVPLYGELKYIIHNFEYNSYFDI